MSIDKILTYDTELTDDIGYTVHPINLALGESLGHTVKVNVYRNGTKITDSASCKAKFLRSDGSTVEINGTFASGVASVTLPSSCYTVEGAAKLSVSLVSGSTISTVFIMICNVNRYSTTAIVDSNQVVPNIETLLANVDKLETLIGEAEGLSLNKVGYAEASGNVLTLYSDNTKKKVVSSVILPSGNSYDDTEIREQLADLNDDLSTLSESIAEIRIGRREHFELGGWSGQGLGNLPTKNDATTVRFRTDKAYLFFAGQTISTLNSPISFMLILADNDGKYVSGVSWTKTYTFNADVLAYITFKHDTDNSSYTDKIDKYGYYFHKFFKDSSEWKGKTWYAFGTSMTDTNTKGKYPQVVDELSGLNRTNKAIGGGGICPSASHGGNVKENIMACPYDVDLVTIECGLNDWGNVALGNIGDKSNDTFIGNFTQCIEHLTNNTRAVVVGIMMVSTTYEADGSRRSPLYLNRYGYTYRDYVSAMVEICNMYGVPVIDVMAEALNDGSKNKDTIIDTIHFTDLGGQIAGRYIWDKLKNIRPTEWRS